MLRLIFIVFGVFAIIPVLIADSGSRLKIAIYAAGFTMLISLFCAMIIVSLGYIEFLREKIFFEIKPYKMIREKATNADFVFSSVWFFSKRHYHFEIDGAHYTAIYFNNIVKTAYGDALLILKDIPDAEEKMAHLINYKIRNLDEAGLIDELKNIGK